MNKTKICKKCGEEKDITLFVKNKKCKDGYRNECKECRKEYMKQYHKENKDKSKQYNQNNKEDIKEYRKQYYEKHKEDIIEYQKQYYQDNKEHYKQHYEENKKVKMEYVKQYKKENPHIAFNSNNRRRSKEEQQGKGIDGKQWFEMMKFFNFRCAYSGEELKNTKDTYGRTIDHIIALENGGLNEIWNVVPMRKGYNCSKQNEINFLDWYKEQEYFDIDRLNKIIEWQIYSYNKYATEDDEKLILIVDII